MCFIKDTVVDNFKDWSHLLFMEADKDMEHFSQKYDLTSIFNLNSLTGF